MSEKVLETRILDWLNTIHGCFAFKINNVGIFDPKRKIYRKTNNRHIHNGISDILFCYQGKFGAIEVKYGRNKPSDKQKQYIKRIVDNGGVAFWVNDFDECKKLFCDIFPNRTFTDEPLFEEIIH